MAAARSVARSSLINTLPDFIDRLTSRKWFLTIGVCIYFMIQGRPAFASLTQVVIAFLAIQGGTDALARVAEARITGQSSGAENSPALDSDVVAAAAAAKAALETEEEKQQDAEEVPDGG